MLIVLGSSGSVLYSSVPIQVAIGEGFREVIIVAFGYFLDDAVSGEFRVLEKVGSELSFGFHGEIKRN